MTQGGDNHRYHRPLRDGCIEPEDFRDRVYLKDVEEGRSGPVSRIHLVVEWPRFFDETRTDNQRAFVSGKLRELIAFWSEADEKGRLCNLWLESLDSGGESVPIRLSEPLELPEGAVEWLVEPDEPERLRFAGKDSHPARVPPGEAGTVLDYVIRMWAAPVRITIDVGIRDVNLAQGRWRVAMRFPGGEPCLYRFDEGVKPPKLGSRLNHRVDETLFTGRLGGVYRAPI